MNALAQACAGLALALAFAVLLLRRRGAVLPVLALQGLAVAAALVAQRGLTAAPLLQGLAAIGVPLLLGWLPESGARRPSRSPVILACVATALTLVVLPLGTPGIPLAIVLIGLLSAATRRDPVLLAAGLALAQGGIALVAAPLVVAFLPVMPLLAIGALWPNLPVTLPLERRLPHWLAPGFRLALPLGTLGTLVAGGNPLSALAGLLVCVLSLPGRANRPFAPVAGWLGVLAALMAAMAADPSLAVLAAAVAVAATVYPRLPRAWDQVALGALGIGLSLLGATATLPSGLGSGLFVIGFAVTASLVPLLAPALVMALLRQPPPAAEPVLLTLGLAAVCVCAAYAWRRPAATRRCGPLFLGQAAVAVFALGLGTPGAAFAGLVHLCLVVLAQAAIDLSGGAPAPRSLALAGLAGVSPIGVFPSLTLIAIETAQVAPWLLLPLGAALAALAWPGLARLAPPTRWQVTAGRLAWLPLTACVLVGWLLPASLAAWLQGLTP